MDRLRLIRWQILSTFLLCGFALTAVSCAHRGFATFKDNTAIVGPNALIQPETFQKIDLARELYPAGPSLEEPSFYEDYLGLDNHTLTKNREILSEAFNKFYENWFDLSQRRNRVQERILAASNQSCAAYKQFLKEFDSETNIFFGALTTATGVMGSIFTAASTARALAGAAGIFSGVRATINESLFADKTIQVLTHGFELKRRELYDGIVKRQKSEITEYPVEAAIKDAIEYHDHCSLNAGLEQVALSVERADDPGLKAAEQTIRRVRRLRQIQETPTDEPLPLEVEESTVLIDGGLNGSPLSAFSNARRKVDAMAEEFKTKLKELAKKDEFGNKSTELQQISKLSGYASQDTKAAILEATKERAEKKDAELRRLRAAVNETIDPKKRRSLEDILRIAAFDGKEISVEIFAIEREYRFILMQSRSYLEDLKQTVDKRIDACRKALQSLIVDMMNDRANLVIKSLDRVKDDAKILALERALLGNDAGSDPTKSKEKIQGKIGAEKAALVSKKGDVFAEFDSLRKKLGDYIAKINDGLGNKS